MAFLSALLFLSCFPSFGAVVEVGFWLLAGSSALEMGFERGSSAVVLMLAPVILSVFDGGTQSGGWGSVIVDLMVGASGGVVV